MITTFSAMSISEGRECNSPNYMGRDKRAASLALKTIQAHGWHSVGASRARHARNAIRGLDLLLGNDRFVDRHAGSVLESGGRRIAEGSVEPELSTVIV